MVPSMLTMEFSWLLCLECSTSAMLFNSLFMASLISGEPAGDTHQSPSMLFSSLVIN